MSKIVSAEILCVGTELLLGDIVNTNAAFLSQGLADLGISVYRHTAVGDNPQRLKAALDAALSSSDLVITSGGLGPTYDDLTKETVAEYFGLPMELHPRSLERIQEYFASTGRAMTENNRKQAMMPRGAHVFDNDYGTAPALAVRDEQANKTVIMLPGPPGELVPLFNEAVAPFLRQSSDSVLLSKNIYIFGMGESAVESSIKELMTESSNPTVAPYCKEGEVRLRVTAKSQSLECAKALCDQMIERIRATEVGRFIYGVDVGSLENALVGRLARSALTVSAAESLTGGLISELITSVSGSSAVFAGGFVTYTNSAKQSLLGVSEQTLADKGAVSAEVAMQMARGARERMGTDIAVSATGLAGPRGDGSENPVGTVFIGVSTRNGERFKKLSLSPMRSREYIRLVSARNALKLAVDACEEFDGK